MSQDNSTDEVEIRKDYYKSGALWRETPYVAGVNHGIDKLYHASGAPWIETPYEGGYKHGIEREYHESGALWEETPYVNGKRHGIEKHYDKDKLNIDCLTLYKGDYEALILCLESYGTASKKSYI